MRRPSGARRWPAGLVAGAAVVLTLTGLSEPATATAASTCSAASGVVIVVDYGDAGVANRCAPGDPASGLAALTAARLPYTFVPRVPGLVCTINRVPDPCNGAPVTAYWSYWHGTPQHTWAFSDVGAGSYNPAPGAVEGWAFGAGTPPRRRPPAVPATG